MVWRDKWFTRGLINGRVVLPTTMLVLTLREQVSFALLGSRVLGASFFGYVVRLMKLTYTCECGKSYLLYEGELVGVPFGMLPQALADVSHHTHSKKKAK